MPTPSRAKFAVAQVPTREHKPDAQQMAPPRLVRTSPPHSPKWTEECWAAHERAGQGRNDGPEHAFAGQAGLVFDSRALQTPVLVSALGVRKSQDGPSSLARNILRGTEPEPTKAFEALIPEAGAPTTASPTAPVDEPTNAFASEPDTAGQVESPPARPATPAPDGVLHRECPPLSSSAQMMYPCQGAYAYGAPITVSPQQPDAQPLVALSQAGNAPPTVLTGMEYDQAQQQNIAYATYYPMYSQVTTDGQYLYFADYASALSYQLQQSYNSPQYSAGQVTVPGLALAVPHTVPQQVTNQINTFYPYDTGGFTTGYPKPLSPVAEKCTIEPPRLGLQDFSSSESNTAMSAA